MPSQAFTNSRVPRKTVVLSDYDLARFVILICCAEVQVPVGIKMPCWDRLLLKLANSLRLQALLLIAPQLWPGWVNGKFFKPEPLNVMIPISQALSAFTFLPCLLG